MKIDILMATYNGEKYLKEQIDSILNQTYSDFRLLISDDASTDMTQEILKEYEIKDNRIIVFFQKQNLGLVKNFEYLIKKVENQYFMFSDQDDIWKKDKIEKSIKKIEETNSDLVYTNLEIVDQNLNLINSSYWAEKGFDKKIKKYNNFNSLYLNNYITGCTMIAKSKWIKKILPIPNNSKYILHDYWIALIISKFGKIDYIEQPLIKYRQHRNNQIGSKKTSDEINDFEKMRNLFIDVKLDHFKIFIEQENIFEDEEIKKLNKISFEYFKKLTENKKIYLKNVKLFWNLYKYENFNYLFQNFLILNIPILAKPLFKIKKGLKTKHYE